MAARAGVQLGVEEKALAKRTPSAASLSRLGVLIAGFPAQLRASERIWSAIMNRMFGGVCSVSVAARACRIDIASRAATTEFCSMMDARQSVCLHFLICACVHRIISECVSISNLTKVILISFFDSLL